MVGCTDIPFSCHVERKIIRGIEFGNSRVIYAKIKAEIDTLGNPKTTKQIREI